MAAANIDEYLGFHHVIESDVEVPPPRFSDMVPRGRVNTTEREAAERINDFDIVENGLDRRGGASGGVPLPAVRPLRIRRVPRRRIEQW